MTTQPPTARHPPACAWYELVPVLPPPERTEEQIAADLERWEWLFWLWLGGLREEQA